MGVCVCVALVFASALTQNVMLQIEVRSDAGAVADATVVANGTTRRTDSMGRTAFDVPPGPVQIVVAKEGFEPETVSIDIRTGEPRAISIALRERLSTAANSARCVPASLARVWPPLERGMREATDKLSPNAGNP